MPKQDLWDSCNFKYWALIALNQAIQQNAIVVLMKNGKALPCKAVSNKALRLGRKQNTNSLPPGILKQGVTVLSLIFMLC